MKDKKRIKKKLPLSTGGSRRRRARCETTLESHGKGILPGCEILVYKPWLLNKGEIPKAQSRQLRGSSEQVEAFYYCSLKCVLVDKIRSWLLARPTEQLGARGTGAQDIEDFLGVLGFSQTLANLSVGEGLGNGRQRPQMSVILVLGHHE